MPPSIDRTKAWTCAGLNQLACPGLGTIMAGRWVGYVQTVIMVAGFFLTMGFMLSVMADMLRCLTHPDLGAPHLKELCLPYAWSGLSGLLLCAIAWLWALISSLSIIRGATQR